MKKRILALALACLMLVSMFPTAIFAADAVCPGKENLHTEANIANAWVKEVVEAHGCEGGYTLYVCNECDTPFMIDTAPDTHNWVDKADVAPKCNADGKTNYKVCSICNEESFTKVESQGTEHSYKAADGFYTDETPLRVCEYCGAKTGTTPAECDNIDTTTGFHEWIGVTPEILTAPTDTAEGEAKFTCAKCGYSEVVKIHNHNLTKHDAVEPSCVNKGNYEYYTCTIGACAGKYYANEEAANKFVATAWSSIERPAPETAHDWDVTNFTAHTESNCVENIPETYTMWCNICEDYFTNNLGVHHNMASEIRVDATCFVGGQYYNICKDCQKPYQVGDNEMYTGKYTENHTAGVSDAIKNSAAYPDYVKELIEYKEWTIVSVKKSGTDEDASYRTCTTGLDVTVKCTACSARLSREVTHVFKVNATGHDFETKTVAPTCATLGFTYVVCNNDNCPTMTTSGLNTEIQTVIAALVADGKLEAAANVISNTAVYTDGNASNTIIEMVKDSARNYIPGTVVINTEEPLDPNKHITNEEITNEATCTADGTKNWNCIYCAANDFGETVPKLNHQMSSATKVDGVDLVSGRHYTYTHSVCERTGCDMNPETEGNQPHTIDGEKVYLDLKAIYDSLEDSVENYHHVYDGNGLTDERAANCALDVAALQSYVCTECGKKIIVKVPNSEYHVVKGDDCGDTFCADAKYNGKYYTGDVKDANYVAPTCTADGYWKAFHCATCGLVEQVVDKDTKTGHDFDKTNPVVAEAAATCDKPGTLAVYKCKNDCGTFLTNTHEHTGADAEANAKAEAIAAYKAPKLHDNADNFTFHAAVPSTCEDDGTVAYYQCKICGKNYANVGDATALTTIVDDKDGHDFTRVQTVTVNCALNRFGFMHYNCARQGCDQEHLVAYVPAPIHTKGDRIEDATVKMNLATFMADESGAVVNTYLAPTCTLNGYQFYKCAVTEGCYYIEYIDALGHVNRNGVNLSDCKNNDETIRDCVRVGCNTPNIPVNEDHLNWVPQRQNIWEPNFVATPKYETFYVKGHKDATCTEDGWDAYVCSHCEYKDEERTVVYGALGHSFGTEKWDADKNTWYKLCTRNCGERIDVDGSGIALSMTTSNALVENAVYTDASTIKLTVKASGMPAASIGGIEFTVDFDKDLVAFTGVKAVGSKFEITTAKVNEDNPNKVTAVLLSAGTVELGTTAEAVVELYFTVKTPAETTITFDIDEKSILATSANANDKYFAQDVTSVSVETSLLMDVDGSNKVDVRDLVALYNLTKKTDAAAAYTSVGDVDRDGKLTLTDLQIIADYIATGASVSTDAYLKIVGRYVAS